MLISEEKSFKRLSPILKWAGGKDQELKYILPRIPDSIDKYFEPFVGGGAVYTSIECHKYFINDKSSELIGLYRNLSGNNSKDFFSEIEEIIHNWEIISKVVANNYVFFIDVYKKFSFNIITEEIMKQTLFSFIIRNAKQFNGMFSETFNFNTSNFLVELQVNLFRKVKRMKHLEGIKNLLPDNEIIDNLETALKSAFYMHFRHIYNNIEKYKLSPITQSAIFLFIRNYAYSGMFRYNSKGDFNVPYGGIGYNNKNFQKKIDYLKSEPLKRLLNSTVIENLDFEDFLIKYEPKDEDFIFLDPPYDSDFSTYAQNKFTQEDQKRLANYLTKDCRSKWMMIIKNTEFISYLYLGKGLNVYAFDKTYLVSFMNRNDKNTEHLLITNY